jgi:hypothetical protein
MRSEWHVGRLAMGMVIMAGSALAQGAAMEGPDLDALARFLVAAKLYGYASGDETRIRLLEDGGREVSSRDGDDSYRGRWYGDDQFSGEEVVWHQGRALWSMNFYGATTPGLEVPADFPRFHKSALRRVSAEVPFRGPALYRESDFVYVNDWTGSITEFSGVERVYFKDAEIFRLVYHGGLLHR